MKKTVGLTEISTVIVTALKKLMKLKLMKTIIINVIVFSVFNRYVDYVNDHHYIISVYKQVDYYQC